ncbi:heterokaryon incompatibility protein-domain-containing protein, partial [Lasiosphaeria hispida]
MTPTVLDAITGAIIISPPRHSGNPASGDLGDNFCHSPLLKQGNIRLLRLLPHKDTKAPIQCQLFEYPLQEPNRGAHLYDALSYVWGSEEDKQPIFIQSHDKGDGSSTAPSTGNNRRLLVTANLHAVLSHIRDRLLERVMWIDAVCINQEDDDEKGLQVQSMAKVYAYANRVIVWLGEAASDSGEAFKALRKAAREQHARHSIERPTQQAILSLLKRPWFQRIWVVQEVAAARHILIKCGPLEIDGFIFCLGLGALKLSYDTCPDLQDLIPPITYLIRDAIFRPRYEASQPETSQPATFSLNIHPLGELVDMYHTRKATNRLDKAYALLGMSSDDPRTAGLLADYKQPWGEVFRKLIQFSLSDQVFIDTWDDCSVAVIQGKGHIVGRVSSVQSDDDPQGDMQSIRIAWKNVLGDFHTEGEENSRFDIPASAKLIHKGDIIYLLHGTLKPTIVRLCNSYLRVIMITAPLSETESRWSEHLRSITTTSPTDFMMIWDWDT